MDGRKVRALRAAVRLMKERSTRDKHDPSGWTYWASSHGTPDPSGPQEPKDPNGRPLYRQCKHGGGNDWEPHFLSWHRPFLFFFEAVLKQAAGDAGETTAFELPYWNWYEDPLPQIFKEGDEKTNPLFDVRGKPAGGVDLDHLIPGLDTAPFLKDDFLIGSGVQKERTFLHKFDENPHGIVHDLVAGNMGRIETAAWDPIFWLHHANLDRLWTAWMKTGNRRLPAPDSTWGTESWFFDSAGNWKAAAGTTLNSEASFGYRYDDEMPPPASIAVAALSNSHSIEAQPIAVPVISTTEPLTTISQTANPIVLGNDAISVKLRIAPDISPRITAFAPESAGGQPDMIVLEDVELGATAANGGFHYNIVASLIPTDGGAARRVRIGSIGTFSLSVLARSKSHDHQDRRLGKQTLTFPLAEVLAALAPVSAKELESGLQISLEPVQPSAPDSPEFVKIGAIKLRASTMRLQQNR
jgi:tyrosinase